MSYLSEEAESNVSNIEGRVKNYTSGGNLEIRISEIIRHFTGDGIITRKIKLGSIKNRNKGEYSTEIKWTAVGHWL